MKTQLKKILIPLLIFLNFSLTNAQTQNYLNVSGNKLYDSTGKEVRLTGVNWFGFETSVFMPHGIWTRDMKSVLQQIKDIGFNTIRVPWCNEMLNPETTVTVPSYGVDAYSGISPMNEEETNVNSPIELMDILVNWCQENDMKIVLDNHSRAADGFLVEGLWYTEQYSEERWINDWVFMAQRYAGKSAVVAMDVNNEPHSATWGDSSPATDWNKAAERCGNAILEVNPDVLIIVEGVGEFEGNSYWWGGNLMGAAQYPIQLSNPSKLMYSAHEYGPEVAPQDWFEDPSFPTNMPAIWNENYDYLYQNETSPIFVGEFGIKFQDAFNGIAYTWFTEFMNFMGSRYSWTFWTMNPNSGDTGGILQDDWVSTNQWKLDVLTPHLTDFIPNVIGDEITNNAPVANFSGYNEPCADNPKIVYLDASLSFDPDGDELSYFWDFGDGTTATGVTVSHDFTNYDFDTAIITLVVSDYELSDVQTNEISLLPGACAQPSIVDAIITTSTNSGFAPLTVEFEATVVVENGDLNDVSLTWNFDNGQSAEGQFVSTIFNEEGEYAVELIASSATNTIITNAIIMVSAAPVPESDLVLNYRNGGNSITDNSINPHFEILNNGTNNVAYEDLSIRYWFTAENNNDLNFWCDWAQLGTANVQGTFGEAYGMNYAEITFSAEAGILNANTSSGNVQTRFAKTNWTNFNEANDYSFDATKTAFTSHEQVTLYENGILVWGIEPNLASKSIAKKPIFSVYPNPTAQYVNVKNDTSLENSTINIYDLAGKLLKKEKINNDTNLVNLPISNLKAGAYIIELVTNEVKQTEILIVN